MASFSNRMKMAALSLLLTLSAAAQSPAAFDPLKKAEVNPFASAPRPFPPSAYAALGSSFVLGGSLPDLGWNEEEIAAFVEGVRGAFQGRRYVLDETVRQLTVEMGRRVEEIEKRKQQQQAVAAPAQAEQFAKYFKELRKRFPLQQSDSGLGYFIQPGRAGVRPRPGDIVVVSCVVLAADAKTPLPQLSNNHVRIKLEGLLPGFIEGLQMMTVDAQGMFVFPPELSFGDGEWPQGVERGSPLIFQVTLHEVIGAGTTP